jgi:hypothetical protein
MRMACNSTYLLDQESDFGHKADELMLSVLAFKQSLFAGVLDGGGSEVFLHGSRLAKFMESVEQATAATPARDDAAEEPDTVDEPAQASAPRTAPPLPDPSEAAAPPPASIPANPWGPLLEVGLQLLGGGGQVPLLETDPESGRAYLKIPVPEPAAVQRLADALRDLRRHLNHRIGCVHDRCAPEQVRQRGLDIGQIGDRRLKPRRRGCTRSGNPGHLNGNGGGGHVHAVHQAADVFLPAAAHA